MSLELKERLFAHLQQIACDRDPYLATAGHFFVQHYIYQELEKYGSVESFEFTVRGKTHQNLILNLPGKQQGFPILVGAHYDAVPGTPGADDNATGVAVLLELARIFASNPAKHPLRLVAFDLEEYGLLGGSGASEYAVHLRQQNQPLRLMISLEMLGYCDSTPGSQQYPIRLLERLYPNCGNFIGLIGNLPTILDLVYLSRSIRQAGVSSEWLPVFNKGLIVPQTRLSDHAHFWDQGYPAMMITDTAMLRNPHYHKASDTIETLNLDFLAGVCLGLVQGLQSL
ncbi:peptidase M28 [Gloeocapsa sp. PCC 7428]|uniref:M28 family peptidase n=1 Tax=Gloeocapsa sp. PCC 7428 TaxID=1173026 RepID=UPI0002A61B5E|nr:M28 family peptidase [Gloeocapsa sp. PCC 7428]AFZ29141.1 peptidase M28 [Gloeocapsa sp. PCC 7428]